MGTKSSIDFDIGVIGGGIAGAAIARDAALRGLTVALFEKNTFGCGSSSKSSKLIHGGIRYLDLAWVALVRGQLREAWKNFRFVFLSLRESRVLSRIAPGLVRPHRIFIPIYVGNRHRRLAVFAGCFVYWLLGFFSGGARMPWIFWSPRSALMTVPQLKPNNLNGGVMIHDHVCDDLALVQAVIASARKNGALCHEQADVGSYEFDPETRAHRLNVRIKGQAQVFRVRRVINASGAWVDEVRHASKEKEQNFIVPVAGAHVWVKSFLPHSVLLEAEDGRIFFVIHFGERSRIGTTERLVSSPDRVKATPQEIDYLLRSVAKYFPEEPIEKEEVLDSDAGVRPLAAPPHALPALSEISREHEIRVGPGGVIHMLGVKLTDHRRAAQEVLDRLMPSLLPFNPKARRKTSTHKIPL